MSFAIQQKLSNQANASATGLPSKLFGFNPWAVDFLLKAACIKSSLLCCVCVPFLISPLTEVMNSVNRVLNSSFWASSIVAKVCFGSGQTQNSVSVCVCAACYCFGLWMSYNTFCRFELGEHKIQRPLFVSLPLCFQTKKVWLWNTAQHRRITIKNGTVTI